jgi:hypothetical protein
MSGAKRPHRKNRGEPLSRSAFHAAEIVLSLVLQTVSPRLRVENRFEMSRRRRRAMDLPPIFWESVVFPAKDAS